MPESVTLDALVVNFALLVAGVFGIGVTYRADQGGDSARWLAVRYLLTVLLGLYRTLHSVVLFGGMRFDFRAVEIALVALPIGLYRVTLGGGTSALGRLHMALVAVLGGDRMAAAARPPSGGGVSAAVVDAVRAVRDGEPSTCCTFPRTPRWGWGGGSRCRCT